jgi:hypothetical protein
MNRWSHPALAPQGTAGITASENTQPVVVDQEATGA